MSRRKPCASKMSQKKRYASKMAQEKRYALKIMSRKPSSIEEILEASGCKRGDIREILYDFGWQPQ